MGNDSSSVKSTRATRLDPCRRVRRFGYESDYHRILCLFFNLLMVRPDAKYEEYFRAAEPFAMFKLQDA